MEGSENRLTATQVINFDDVVFFRIPTSWRVATEPDGQVIIFEDVPQSGTLRPWQQTYTFADAETCSSVINDIHQYRALERLSEKTLVSTARVISTQEGERLTICTWNVTVQIDPLTMRVITFSYANSPEDIESEQARWELLAINLAVRNALYADSGTPTHNVP
jgi:hypothetical protein